MAVGTPVALTIAASALGYTVITADPVVSAETAAELGVDPPHHQRRRPRADEARRDPD
jgi:hypothetical protein